MIYKALLAMPAMVLALGVGAALAAPGVKDLGMDGDSLVLKTHACHRSCELGPAGWHRHVGARCVRVACLPRAQQPFRCYVDRWGVRRCAY
jgi:hypothetical protein